MDVTYEAEAPEPPGIVEMYVSPSSLVIQAGSAVPGDLAQDAAEAGAEFVSVSVVTAFSDAYPFAVDWRVSQLSTLEPVPLGDQTTPNARPFSVRGIHRLLQPGVNDLRPSTLTVRLTFTEGDGTAVGTPLELTCRTQGRPVADTVWVRSGTGVDHVVGDEWSTDSSRKTFAYGQPIPVQVRVLALGSTTPAGWVDVSLDGVARRVRVEGGNRDADNDGIRDRASDAVAVLPGPGDRTGLHSIVASFVPDDARFYRTGGYVIPPGVDPSCCIDFYVTSVHTKPRLQVTKKRSDRVTRIRALVEADFDSTPTGKVKVTLRRLGGNDTRSKTKVVRGSRSRADARFGRLRPGRYTVVVKYRGDDNHRGSRTTRTFRIRRG